MTLQSPRFSEAFKIEDDPKYERYFKTVFIDKSKLSDKAVQICKELHINPDDMIDKTLDFFIKGGKDLREVAELRYNHYQNKRRKYMDQIIKEIGPISKKKQRSPYLNNSMININNQQSPQGGNYNNNVILPQIGNALKMQIYNLQQQQSLTSNNSPNRSKVQSNMLQLSPLSPQKPNNDIQKPVTVGKASFRPAQPSLSQDFRIQNNLSQNSNNNNKAAFLTQSPNLKSGSYGFPQSTRSLDNNHEVKLAQKILEKEQQRVNKLRRQRLNAVMLAEQEIQKYEQKIQTKHQKFGLFQENMKRKQFEDQKKVQQVQQKRSTARQYFSQTMKEIENKAQSIFDIRLQEINQMSLNKSIREKSMSNSQYLKFQSKYKEELLQNSKQPYLKRREDQETSQYLDRLEYKIDSGFKKAQNQLQQNVAQFTNKFETSLQETYKNYQSLVEQQFNESIDKVRMKDMMIESKLKKKQQEEQKRRDQIRDLISQKFDRNKIQRHDLLQQSDKRSKATLDRIDNKLKIHQSLSEQRDIQNMKRKEINSLRMLDQRENNMKNKEQMLLDKSKVMTKMQRIEESKRQAEVIKKNVFEKMKFSNLIAERDVLTNIKPKEVLLKAKLNLTLQMTQSSPQNRIKKRNAFSSSLPGFKSARVNNNNNNTSQELQ